MSKTCYGIWNSDQEWWLNTHGDGSQHHPIMPFDILSTARAMCLTMNRRSVSADVFQVKIIDNDGLPVDLSHESTGSGLTLEQIAQKVNDGEQISHHESLELLYATLSAQATCEISALLRKVARGQ